jgi:hypothetical protein
MDLRILEVKRLRDKFKMNLPQPIRELVSFEHPVYGESVQWHIDTDSKVAVLSRSFEDVDEDERRTHSLRSENFIPLERVNVTSGSTVVLISEVRNSVEWEAEISGQVAYLAHDEMLEGERRSVYLVGGEVAREMIDKGVSVSPDYEPVLSATPE